MCLQGAPLALTLGAAGDEELHRCPNQQLGFLGGLCEPFYRRGSGETLRYKNNSLRLSNIEGY
jgi:hypothetical protein